MIRLIAFSNPRVGQAFIDHMALQGVEIQMERESDQYVLWLLESKYEEVTTKELNQFLADPYRKEYQEASWQLGDTHRAKFSYPHKTLSHLVTEKAGIFTLAIVMINVIVFVLFWLGLAPFLLGLMHFPIDSTPLWQIWRLFTHAFLHFSLTHLLFNVLWWWVFGGRIEKVAGSAKLFQLFLLTALFSGLGQYAFSGANFGGMSGVIYGLLGYLWVMGRFAPQRGLMVEPALAGFMLIWLVIGYFEPLGMSVANEAHLFGLLSGCVIGIIDAMRTPTNKTPPRQDPPNPTGSKDF